MSKLPSTTSKQKRLKPLPAKRSLFLVATGFMAIFALVGAYWLFGAEAAPRPRTPAVTLSISPASARLAVGQEAAFAVRLNTNSETVNAVQADINYPADKFEFVRVDAAGSMFEIDAANSSGSGFISIARGTVTPVNSADAYVATIYLKPVASGRKVKINLASTSAVVRASDSANVLGTLSGGTYTIQ